MSEAPPVPSAARLAPPALARPLAPVVRLRTGLLDEAPGPDVLVTMAGPLEEWSIPEQPTGQAAVADLTSSLEVLHEVAQSVLGSLSSVQQAPRELETVVALAAHRIESITATLEARLTAVATDVIARVDASAEAATSVRLLVRADATEQQEKYATVMSALLDRLEASEAAFLAQSAALVKQVSDNAAEAAELVLLAAEKAVTEIDVHVRELRNERRRNERAYDKIVQRLDVRMDELSVRIDDQLSGLTAEAASGRRFRR
jgi:hypothetical protein